MKVFKRKMKKRQLCPYYILQGGDLEFVVYCIVVVGTLSLPFRCMAQLYKDISCFI